MSEDTPTVDVVKIGEATPAEFAQNGFAIDLMGGHGYHTGSVGAGPIGVGRFTTMLEVDQVDANGEPTEYPVVHVYSDFDVSDLDDGPGNYSAIVDFLRDIANGLDHPVAREAYLEGQRARVEASVQATGPEGETVSEDAK
jgi:hypothetical protein